MTNDIAKDVRMFIVENFLFSDEKMGVAEEASLLDAGIIDSTGILELVSFIEDKFNIRINDAEIVPDNLDSIAKITRFVTAKTSVSAVA